MAAFQSLEACKLGLPNHLINRCCLNGRGYSPTSLIPGCEPAGCSRAPRSHYAGDPFRGAEPAPRLSWQAWAAAPHADDRSQHGVCTGLRKPSSQ